ncbi:hypothetical protein JTB14_028264 [Gonioctena quinquepunctata]|nr:hypothetical protein JTB14_028264 [Gonioctena quinquepunctata]
MGKKCCVKCLLRVPHRRRRVMMLRFSALFCHFSFIVIVQATGKSIETETVISPTPSSEREVDCGNWENGTRKVIETDFNCTIKYNGSDCAKEVVGTNSTLFMGKPTCFPSENTDGDGEEIERQEDCLNCTRGEHTLLHIPIQQNTNEQILCSPYSPTS